jgi:hypothetical protein
MTSSICKTLLFLFLFLFLFLPFARGEDLLEQVDQRDGAYTLAAGPKVEGLVYLQGLWNEKILQAFHGTPWIDAASARIGWADFEPHDQQFNWQMFDKVLGEVKKYNAAHPGAHRTLQIRVMGGDHIPKWFAEAGVKLYETRAWPGPGGPKTVHPAIPFDNPQYLKQLRELYHAMVEKYKDEPLVTVYHGTWSAGPWDEIFVPHGGVPDAPGATPEKYIQGHLDQLDVLIDEISLRGKVAELPYSGAYSKDRKDLDLTRRLTTRIVSRLGRRSPFLYIQSNGWGSGGRNWITLAWDHEEDLYDAYGQVNLALQAIGSNAGGNWIPQGDWVENMKVAERFEAAYCELYSPDFMPPDTAHHLAEACTQPEYHDGFLGYRPWLGQRNRTLYVREGRVVKTFRCGQWPRNIERLVLAASVPAMTSIKLRARTRLDQGPWSDWQDAEHVEELPRGQLAQIEATLHTDDGLLTPRLARVEPRTGPAWAPPAWVGEDEPLPATPAKR